MDVSVAEDYKSSLNDLNFNSKPLINMLTMLAEENKRIASTIVKTIINHITEASFCYKLPGLYLVDSIMKNVGGDYLKIFCEHIVFLFGSVFGKVDETTRSQMYRLRQTWTDVLPNKILYDLDMRVKKLDPAWPVTAKSPTGKVFLNPKFLDRSVEQKKASCGTSVSLNKEEKMKTDTGEVLKQLLVRQEQLKLIERKKQLSIKKQVEAATSNSSTNILKVHAANNPENVKTSKTKQKLLSQEVSFNTNHKKVTSNATLPLSNSNGKTASVLKSNTLTDNESCNEIADDKSCAGKHTVTASVAQGKCNSDSSAANSVIVGKSVFKSGSFANEDLKKAKKLDKDIYSNKRSISQKKVSEKKSNKNSPVKRKFNFLTSKNDEVQNISNANEFNLVVKIEEPEKLIMSLPIKKNVSDCDEARNTADVSEFPLKGKTEEPKKLVKSFPARKNVMPDCDNNYLKLKALSQVDTIKKKAPSTKVLNKVEKSKISGDSDIKPKVKHEVKRQLAYESVPLDKYNEMLNELKYDNDTVLFTKVKEEIPPMRESSDEEVSTKSDIMSLKTKDNVESNSNSLRGETSPLCKSVTETFDTEIQESEPPKKKMKNKDIENLNPGCRKRVSPVLFGSKDQDHRVPRKVTVAKRTVIYPESQGSCNSVLSGAYDLVSSDASISGEKFKYRQQHPDPLGLYRGRSYHARRRFMSQRGHFMLGLEGRFREQYSRDADASSVTVDVSTCLKQAEEKYMNGRISEDVYKDLCHDLQKMTDNGSCLPFSNQSIKLNILQQERSTEGYTKGQEFPKQNSLSKIQNIQSSSTVCPPVKPFVLDHKNTLIYFADDRAFVMMNAEPRELTFKDKPREVFILGLDEPLTLRFDGKPVEFKMHGKIHSVRLGTPGREIYIDNHPYVAQFGGPPIAVLLDDGHIYELFLSGPAPLVNIADKPSYELVRKCHNINVPCQLESEEAVSITPKTLIQDMPSPSKAALQDVDMRVKPNNEVETNILVNSNNPFYSKNMKDTDWRHIQQLNNTECDNKEELIIHENQPKKLDSWYRQEIEKIGGSYYTKEACREYSPDGCRDVWVEEHKPVSKIEGQISDDPTYHENWRSYGQEDGGEWRSYSQCTQPAQQEHYQVYQDSNQHSNEKTNFYDNSRRNYSNNHYSRRPRFYNRRMRGRIRGIGFGLQLSNFSKVPPRQRNLFHQPKKPTVSQKALLPTPHSSLQSSDSVISNHPSPMDTSAVAVRSNRKGDSGLWNVTETSDVKVAPLSVTDMEVDVESLLQKLVTAGIINTKPHQETSSSQVNDIIEVSTFADTVEKEENDSMEDEVPEIMFISESLRTCYKGVVSALHKGFQCTTCGMRFLQKETELYSHHLDWHFRANRREKDRFKKAQSRSWYCTTEEWIPFAEFEDSEKKVPSYFENEANIDHPIEESSVPSVPASSEIHESCSVCGELFETFWMEDEEEWHLRDVVRHGDLIYHPACYEDYKKGIKAERDHEEQLILKDTAHVINTLLDNICETWKKDDELEAVSDLTASSVGENLKESSSIENKIADTEEDSIDSEKETVHNNCSESDYEEYLLEGKPGEEEIIGLISESDFEAEPEIPKTEAKMIIMHSGGITLKVKAESLQCSSPSNMANKDNKSSDNSATLENDDIDFRPPTPDPNFQVMPPVSRGSELSGLCCIM